MKPQRFLVLLLCLAGLSSKAQQGSTPEKNKPFKLRSNAEWATVLTPTSIISLENAERNAHLPVNTGTTTKREFITAQAANRNYSNPKRNMNQVVDGQAFLNPPTRGQFKKE